MTEEKLANDTADGVVKKDDGDRIIKKHVIISMGIGLIPVPMVDFVGITGAQLNMLRRLAKIYEIPFSEDKVKNILGSLIGGVGSVPVSIVFASLVKSVPVIGQTVGALSMPITAGAMTYAVGRVFLQHFASGGTFLTFDPEEVRAYYAEMFKEGEKTQVRLRKGKAADRMKREIRRELE